MTLSTAIESRLRRPDESLPRETAASILLAVAEAELLVVALVVAVNGGLETVLNPGDRVALDGRSSLDFLDWDIGRVCLCGGQGCSGKKDGGHEGE